MLGERILVANPGADEMLILKQLKERCDSSELADRLKPPFGSAAPEAFFGESGSCRRLSPFLERMVYECARQLRQCSLLLQLPAALAGDAILRRRIIRP